MEHLFWGPGHVLQFVFGQWLLLAWTVLARAWGLPLGFLVLRGGRWRPGAPREEALVPVHRALWSLLGLFAAGGLLAWLIRGGDTLVPAHYRGSRVGVTLALMGCCHRLLPRLGYPLALGPLARVQPLLYGAG